MGQGKTSTDVDTIVGYVIAPESFRVDYMNQTWFMADDADAESAEFKAPVFPGDQLVMTIELPTITRRFGKGTGTLSVGGQVVTELAMAFALVDK